MTRLLRVLRGGCWFYGIQDFLRASGRYRRNPSVRVVISGFRCVRGVAIKGRSLRGGSWNHVLQGVLRASGRGWYYPSRWVSGYGGFRCVRGRSE